MTQLCLILGDQLSHALPSLLQMDSTGVILMCEVMDEARYVSHHPKKIAFIFSAMRHFAEELRAKGHHVRYITLDDPLNTGSFCGEVVRAVRELAIQRVIVTEPGEMRVLEMLQSWPQTLGVPVDILPDSRFICSLDEFRQWANGRKQLRMEFFYRQMRLKTGLLIEPDGQPTGGQWNYDKENRKSPPRGLASPMRVRHEQDAITKEVLALVTARFSHHFGRLDGFHLAVTRAQALIELEYFIQNLLPDFGDYQDAMVLNEPFLYHSLISTYLNVGLLLPLEICQLAETAYREGKAPLNAVEGFIRQILGWREYVRGIYWHLMPDYGEMNYLQATENLPEFYWTGKTQMACVAEAVRHTMEHAYSHHIQRLMVTGNFALLAGIDVKQVQEWYLAVYSDAYEWVEMPNTLGMALFGDGGIMASKPYAASGKYIQRMSNFCQKCHYDVAETTTPNACPFNALYWDFMARHRDVLQQNQRLPYIYSNWDKFGEQKQQQIRQKAIAILKDMRQGSL